MNRRTGSRLCLALVFAFSLPVAVLAQNGQGNANGNNNGSQSSILAIPTLGPLGILGLAAGVGGAGLLLTRKRRDKNKD
ncbi:MAG: LPXTG cell wall anchor domain-containing protein [Thermoanaerobaculia bacterium]